MILWIDKYLLHLLGHKGLFDNSTKFAFCEVWEKKESFTRGYLHVKTKLTIVMQLQDFPKPSSPKGRQVSNKSGPRIIYSFHNIWLTMLVQLFDLIAGVELCEVWNVPEESEDDNRHHIDCARQTGEPKINRYLRFDIWGESGRYLRQILEMAESVALPLSLLN